jgi:hypothetical protein
MDLNGETSQIVLRGSSENVSEPIVLGLHKQNEYSC